MLTLQQKIQIHTIAKEFQDTLSNAKLEYFPSAYNSSSVPVVTFPLPKKNADQLTKQLLTLNQSLGTCTHYIDKKIVLSGGNGQARMVIEDFYAEIEKLRLVQNDETDTSSYKEEFSISFKCNLSNKVINVNDSFVLGLDGFLYLREALEAHAKSMKNRNFPNTEIPIPVDLDTLPVPLIIKELIPIKDLRMLLEGKKLLNCPIFCETMENPTTLITGWTFEKTAIERRLAWENTFRIAQTPISNPQKLIPNIPLKNLCDRLRKIEGKAEEKIAIESPSIQPYQKLSWFNGTLSHLPTDGKENTSVTEDRNKPALPIKLISVTPLELFFTEHDKRFKKDKRGVWGLFRKTEITSKMGLSQIIEHARKPNRSRQVCIELGWMKKDGTLNTKNPDLPREVIEAYTQTESQYKFKSMNS